MRSFFEDCEALKRTIRKVMYGTISHIDKDTLFVILHDLSHNFKNTLALCIRQSQTPKQRGKYIKASVLPFHVSPSLVPVYDGSAPHVQIKLSRNSKKLLKV